MATTAHIGTPRSLPASSRKSSGISANDASDLHGESHKVVDRENVTGAGSIGAARREQHRGALAASVTDGATGGWGVDLLDEDAFEGRGGEADVCLRRLLSEEFDEDDPRRSFPRQTTRDSASSPYENCGHQVRDILDMLVNRPHASIPACIFQAIVVIVILLATCSACIQTIPELKDEPIFGWLNAGFTIMFTMELSLRLLASQSLGLFLTDHYNLIDILAVMPGYLELADSHWPQAKAFMSLRIIRLLWVLQMMRLAKVTLTSKIFGACLSMSAKICHTSILVEITLILGLATVSAGFLYLAESDYCDAVGIACRGFESIPAACWFAVTTLTTVGYGDSVPMTVLGKVFAAITSICGIMVVSLAGAMLSWDFAEHFREERVKRRLEAQLSRKTPAKVLEDYQEMQETLSEFSEACNSLMASLSHASANSSLRNVESEEIVSSRTPSKHAQPHGSVLDGYIAFDNLETEPVLADSQAAAAGAAARQQLVKGPMLRLLQERARVLCEEAKGAAFACLADSGVVLSGRGL